MTRHTLHHTPGVLPGLGHLVANLHFFSAANHCEGKMDLSGKRRSKPLSLAAPTTASPDPITLLVRGASFHRERWSHERGWGAVPVVEWMPFMNCILRSQIQTRFKDQLELEWHAICHSCHPLPACIGYLKHGLWRTGKMA